jgi:2-polyprenyl-3-methyl-5-hydroxy-6-metoxy-1,4-benzoquinol methylase
MSAPLTLESVACDLCGQDDADLLVVKIGFHVVRCRNCSLVYVNPRPKLAALSAQYEVGSFFAHQVTRANDESWRPEALARLDLINRLHPTRGTLLDVGCSAGWFMSVAQDAGWKVSGIDVSGPAVSYSKSRGFDAKVATLDDHGFAPASFDVITMFDCIEHMPSPMRALNAVRTLLAPGGIVMLTTPNVDGFFPRLTYQILARPFGAWDHPGPPGHIYQFGMRTMSAALEQSGFAVVDARTTQIPLDFSVGALEDSIVDAMKGAGRRVSVEPAMPGAKPVESTGESGAAARPRVSTPARVMRRIVRGAGGIVAWVIAGSVSPSSQLLGKGDSMMIVARAAA